MAEQLCTVGDVTLCYETFGEADCPTMLLIMGLGMQMLAWPDEFCEMLAARGFRVVRFDNRDVGRSTHFDALPPPTPGQLLRRSRRAAAYTLSDMAADAAGLLDELGVGTAHVAGASMGGMIAQTLGARHFGRVLSLVSIMSSTGSRLSGQPALRALPLFLSPPPAARDEYVDHAVRLFALVGSPGFPRDDDELRAMLERSYERSHDPAGTGRQLAAILASGNRLADLRRITAPTLVIHGSRDRLVAPSGGRATAKAIPGARLMIIDGMGHDLPRGAWSLIVDGIVQNAARQAESVGRAAASPAAASRAGPAAA